MHYAVDKGVLVVAAVGNADDAPTEPWGYAGYPAALPHVLGVSADRARRLGVLLLEPRPPSQRHCGSGRGHLLDAAEGAHGGRPARVRAPGLLRLRPDRVPARRRHVVLGSSSLGPRRCSFSAVGRLADQVANALTRSAADAGPDSGMRSLLDRPRRRSPAGACSTSRSAVRGLERLTARSGPLRGERRGVDRRRDLGSQGAADSRHGRLLGRPGRRLQDQASPRAATRRATPRARRTEFEPLPLEAGHRGRWQVSRSTGGCSRRSRSLPARPRRSALTCAKKAGTTSWSRSTTPGAGTLRAQLRKRRPQRRRLQATPP